MLPLPPQDDDGEEEDCGDEWGADEAAQTREKFMAIGGSLLLAGLTITCSLSLNNAINALFNCCFPEPEDRYKRFYYRLVVFVVVLAMVTPLAYAVTNNCRAKQSLIDMDDFAPPAAHRKRRR